LKIRNFFDTLATLAGNFIKRETVREAQPIRVVFDTNIIVAAITNPGSASGYLLNEAVSEGKIRMCVSPAILREYEIILKSFQFALNKQRSAESFLRVLETASLIVHPQAAIHKIQADKSDNKFLECAVQAKADYLVTSDKHFNFQHYREVAIVRSTELEKVILREDQDTR